MGEQSDLEPGPNPTAHMREQTLALKKAIGGSAITKIAEMPRLTLTADLRMRKMLGGFDATPLYSEQMRKAFAGLDQATAFGKRTQKLMVGFDLTAAHSEQMRKAFAGLDQATSFGKRTQKLMARFDLTSSYIDKMRTSFNAFGVQALAVQKHLAPMHATFERFQRTWHEAQAQNWPVGFDEIMRIIDFMRETGYCLVWAPRPEIIEELLQAAPADRRDVLLLRREEILDDLTAVIADVGEPSLQMVRQAAEEALAMFRAGSHFGAQALAAVIFTEVIHTNLYSNTSKALKLFMETEPEEAVLRELRLRAIFVPARRALSSWFPLEGQPVPDNFNRHASLHRLTAGQYTEHNALVGLMLVIPLVREVDAWLKVARAKKEQRELASSTS